MDKKVITNNSLETQRLGSKFARKLKAGDIVLLFGNLGAGKTTFVQGLAKGMCIKDRILSPTFVIHRSHGVSFGNIKYLNHVDLYRIENQTEIENLGLPEIVGEESSVTVIEWADRLSDFKPQTGYKIWFKYLDENKREITVSKI